MSADGRRTSIIALALAAALTVPAAAASAAPVRVSAKTVKSPLGTKAAKSTVTVRNTGKRKLKGLTLAASAPKGVKVTPRKRKLKPLRAGKSVRIGVKLRRASGGPQRGSMTFKVLRRGKTMAKGRLKFGGSGGKPAPTPPVNPNSLAGRYFWGSLYTLNGIDAYSLFFTGPDLVATELTEDGWPVCTAVTENCKPYTYDAATNALTIDGRPATLNGRSLDWDSSSYGELGFPDAGARWDAYITYADSSGLCPTYCTYYREDLLFQADGRFVRDAVVSGTGPVVDWGAIPPDSKGTYEIRPDHTLRLAFEDGTERIDTVGMYMNDDGTLQPPGDGVIIGGDGYFDISD